MYSDFFSLFRLLLTWITNPGLTNLLLIGLVFGVCYRFYKWFSY